MLAALAAYKSALLAVAIAAVLVFAGVQTVRVERAKADLARVEGRAAVAEEKLAAQAAALATLKAEAERRDAESAQALTAAKRSLANATARAAALQAAKVPEDCPGAVDWAADRGRELGAW